MNMMGVGPRRARWMGCLLASVCAACAGTSSGRSAHTTSAVAADASAEATSGYAAHGRGAAAPMAPSGQASAPPAGGHGGSRSAGSSAAPRASASPAPTVSVAPPVSAGEGADALAAPPSEDQCAARRAVEGPRTRARTIKACYERELAQDPTLRGTVWVEFVVLPDGSVDVISTESTVTPTVGACVAEVIGTLQYTPCPGYPSTRHRPPIVFEHG